MSEIRLRVSSSCFTELTDEAQELLASFAGDTSGFIAGEILVNDESTAIVILTDWIDRHAWARSRYDERVGRLLEHCTLQAEQVDYAVYGRLKRFANSTPSR